VSRNEIIDKLLSGRYLLTVICGGTFAYLACSGRLPAKDAQTIVAIVVTFYFTSGPHNKRADEGPVVNG